MDNDMREYGSMGVGIANIRELCEMHDRLRGVSDKMTPKQAEHFRFVETHYQSAHTEDSQPVSTSESRVMKPRFMIPTHISMNISTSGPLPVLTVTALL